MSTNAIKLQTVPFTAVLGNSLSNACAFAVSKLSAWMRPQAESPADSAQRLRSLADGYSEQQPSYAADLRAAADQYDVHHGA